MGWWLRHPEFGYFVGKCGNYALSEKSVHGRSCHESERPVVFVSEQEAWEFFLAHRELEGFRGDECAPWAMTDEQPCRVLFDGPEEAFAWPDDIRFLQYVDPMPFLMNAYNAVFKWNARHRHWTCVQNTFGPWHPRVYTFNPADGIVNVVRGRCND